MQVCRLFFRIAPERDEGTIKIHYREGEQSEEGFLLDHRKKVRPPRIRAKLGLGQHQIHLSGVVIPHLTP